MRALVGTAAAAGLAGVLLAWVVLGLHGWPWTSVLAVVAVAVAVAWAARALVARRGRMRRRTALHVKLTGQRGDERLDALLGEYNPCFVSLVSLERCELASVPPRICAAFVNLTSLNLRDNRLVSLQRESVSSLLLYLLSHPNVPQLCALCRLCECSMSPR